MSFETADFRIESIDLSNIYDVKLVTKFLASMDFDFAQEAVEYTMILYNLNNQLMGTGSYMKGVLKYVAISPQFRETAAFAQVVTHLNDRVLNNGEKTVLVFTKPESSIKFQGLGFKEIAVVEPLYALLDFGYYTIDTYKKYLRGLRRDTGSNDIASIVVNCNPVTNGHLYLIEKAAAENEVVYLFVVEEDRSVFPFATRYALIEKAIAHLDNVVMVKGSRYVVSGATFPSYFLKNESVDLITRKQTELDVTIFAHHIAPQLSIKKRYVGTEVYCKTTAAYNETMLDVLPPLGIQLIEVSRKTVDGAENYISASKVRAAIKCGDIDSIKSFVPPATFKFLKSSDAETIIESIQSTDNRH
jgi:[citrate (pro-3S)-lyase] ligase